MKDGFIVAAGGGDPLRQHVRAVAPAQRLKSSEQRVTCNAFVSRAIAGRTSVCNCNCAVNKKMLVRSTARHTGVQTFAVKNGVNVFGLNELDKLYEAESVTCDCARFLKSLAALDAAADALAAELNVVKPVVEDFIDAANEEG